MYEKQKKRTQDDIRIDVDQDYELSYWTKKFGISRDELKKAVDEVGPYVLKVKKLLEK